MAATNYTIYKGSQITGFKLGGTAWTSANWSATAATLASSFATNNPTNTVLLDLCGPRDSNSPVKSDAFVKDITFSGNERNIEETNLLGSDTTGAQNKEVVGGSVSRVDVEVTLVLRNNVPMSVFNDGTECALITLDNTEGTTSGLMNIGCNNLTMGHVGSLTFNPDGLAEQKMKFSFKGGTTTYTPTSVSYSGQTWSKIMGGDYAEEVRCA